MPHPHTNSSRTEPYLRILRITDSNPDPLLRLRSRRYYCFGPCACFANARSTEYEGLSAPRVGTVDPYVGIL
ncbi:hypothetical protein PISMIDRAFT_690313 [Pisolithus microcarpus 441]|uniref:Uncharacterized protein n=1 Tax=Pisolithus microcarpus 441 TaxID=765257 RepID=A0A0C9Y373_9AGAM|nr:hypothetical protein PISMIDRAFT_690313 [Pisolithus microcarpus 441]